MQSFSDFLLRKIGRIHTAHQAIQAVRRAYQAGLTNISVDLMYGLPNQSTNDFRNSLLQVVHLPVSHVSVYGLTVEDGTYFGVQKQKIDWHCHRKMKSGKCIKICAEFFRITGSSDMRLLILRATVNVQDITKNIGTIVRIWDLEQQRHHISEIRDGLTLPIGSSMWQKLTATDDGMKKKF